MYMLILNRFKYIYKYFSINYFLAILLLFIIYIILYKLLNIDLIYLLPLSFITFAFIISKLKPSLRLFIFIIFVLFVSSVLRHNFLIHNSLYRYINETKTHELSYIINQPLGCSSKCRYIVSEITVDKSTVEGKAMLYIDNESLDIGQRYNSQGIIKGIKNFSKEFDYQSYMFNKEVFASIDKVDNLSISIEKAEFFSNLRYSMSKTIIEIFKTNFKSDDYKILISIVFGNIGIDDKIFLEDISELGLSHIFAVSGYNVALLLIFIEPLYKYMGRNRMLYIFLILLLLYMCIVGFDNIPAMRAFLMLVSKLITIQYGFRFNKWNLVFLTMLIILLLNPASFLLISFQLSFAVIILFNMINIDEKETLFGNLKTTIVAQIATLPITVLNFGKISIISPISNFIILPFIPLLTVSIILYIPLSYFPAINNIGVLIIESLLYFIEFLVKIMRKVPINTLNLDNNMYLFFITLIVIIFIYKFEKNYRCIYQTNKLLNNKYARYNKKN